MLNILFEKAKKNSIELCYVILESIIDVSTLVVMFQVQLQSLQ